MHRWPHSSREKRSERIAKRRSSERWISPSWAAGSRDWEPHGPSLASIASPSSRPMTGWEATPTPSTSTTEAGRSLSIQASSSTTSGTTPTWCSCSNISGFRPSGATCRSRSRRWRGVRVPGARVRVARAADQPGSSRLPAHGRRHRALHTGGACRCLAARRGNDPRAPRSDGAVRGIPARLLAAGDRVHLVLQLGGDARLPGSIDGRVPRQPRPPRWAASADVEDRDGR